MVTKVEYEDACRAAVELGDPLAPKTLHAVLEAAEGARGTEHTALVDGLRGVARQLSHTARDWSSLQAADAEKMVMSAAHAVQEASDRLARLSLPPPEAKDGAAPSHPETPERGVANGGPSGPSEGVRTEPSVPRSGTAAPSPETGWPPRPRSIADRRDETDVVQPAAPAAPSLDLAALEELATWLGDTSSLEPQYRKRVTATLRTAILHLKAQPNAGPSADGGKGATK